MRYVLANLLWLILLAPAYAEKVEVDLEQLSPDTQRAVLKARTAAEKTSWVGLGKEVGVAINDALGAVVGNAEKFGATKVGYFTMFLVFWKIAGIQIMRILIGFLILIVVDSAILWSYRRTCLPYRVLTETSSSGKKWTLIEPKGDASMLWGARVVHAILFGALTAISFALMFA